MSYFPSPTDLSRLLRPKSVAIIGASDSPAALGASVLANLERFGYDGEIHLVNPKRDAIGTRPCVRRIDDLPACVDAAVLAIPRPAVLAAIGELAHKGVGAAIVFSAGFAEGGPEGLAEQHEIARFAADSGMIVLGPNCLGSVNYVDGVPLTFVETHPQPADRRPELGIVSQSGAMAAVLSVMIAARHIGKSLSISTGNEAVTGVEDYVEQLVADDDTRVIVLLVELFRRPERFLAAAREARRKGKTIVLLHPGTSSAARASAATHTGAMAGDHEVMRVKVERAGVVLVETLEELADVAELAVRCPPFTAAGPVVIGESGAFKALTLDLAERLGLPLPAAGDEDAPALRAALPDFVGVSNPLDVTAQGLVDRDLYYRTLAAVFDDDRFGSIVLGIIQTDATTTGIKIPPILRALREHRPGKPVIYAGLDEGSSSPSRTSMTCAPSVCRACRPVSGPCEPSPA